MGRLKSPGLVFWLYACGFALTVAIIVVTGVTIEHLRRQEIADTRRQLRSLATVLADQADRALQGIELIQQRLLDDFAAAGIVDPAGFDAAVSSETVHDTLRLRIAALPQVNAITLNNSRGKLLNFSRYWPIPDVNIADRDYFKALNQDASLDRFISEPVPNRGDGKWTLFIARRVNGPANRFLGLVLGAVELDYFQSLYARIAPEPDYVLCLVRADGTLLVRQPMRPNAVGKVFAAVGSQKLSESGSDDLIRMTSPIDGHDRLVATASLNHFPIRFVVARTVDATLARWRGQAIALGVAAGLLEVGVLLLLWLIIRSIRSQRRLVRSEHARRLAEARAESERAHRELLARYGIALDNMAQGLCMFDAAGRLLVVNEQLKPILGLPDLPPIGQGGGDFLRRVLAGGLLPRRHASRMLAQLRRAHGRGEKLQLDATLTDGRSLLLHMQPMTGGGFLLTCSDVTEQRRAEAEIAFLAHCDALTELPNRESLLAALDQTLRRRAGTIAAVLCINLQRFREVNDTFGHTIGDLLLREIAHRLRRCAGSGGLAARIGGDEFAIVPAPLDRMDQLEALVARLVDDVTRPCQLGGHTISVGIRVGVAETSDAKTSGAGTGSAATGSAATGSAGASGAVSDAESLLGNAHLAMRFSPTDADSRPVFFRPEMIGAMHADRELEADLLRALHEGELRVHYQPLVRLDCRDVVGFEALLRWRHPDKGWIAPADFIPLAERTGLIVPIGEWVLRTACTDAASWPADRKIAVNLSAVQARDRRLVPAVASILKEVGLRPERLELEITETVLLRDTADTLEILHELRHLGVSIALDDFGTGYSSLSYLRSFPFDKVKVDRAFIRDLTTSRDARAIVHAILGLCAELGITTLAEGIEHQAQVDALLAEGCRDGQGFLFGHATPAGLLAPFLDLCPTNPVLEPFG